MPPLQDPPIRSTEHTIRQVPQNPPSILLPFITRTKESCVKHWDVMLIEFGALEEESGYQRVRECRWVEDCTKRMSEEKGCICW
jgi:hypothetical protein